MGYSVKDKSKPRVLPPEGNHIVRCYTVFDLGTQIDTWEGREQENEKVYIGFEFPKKKHVFSPEKGEEPFVIGQEFNQYLGKGKFRNFLDSWLDRPLNDGALKQEGFDLETLIGMTARIKVVHVQSKSGNTYAKIGAIMPLDDDVVCPPMINQPVYVWLHPDAFNIRDWLNGYKWLQEKAAKSPEYQKLERLGLTNSDAAYRRPKQEGQEQFRQNRQEADDFYRSENEARPSVAPDLDDASEDDLPW